MKYAPSKNHRKTIRLKGYDYSEPGAYFITIRTKDRECFFGNIVDDKMVLNNCGWMIEKWYFEIPNKFPDIHCDQYIIMPNHIHFIIINVGADLCVCPNNACMGEHTGSPLRIHLEKHACGGEHIGSPLHRVVQWFKTMTMDEYIKNVKNNGWKPFNGKLWQRNYYEHIIRNENELNRIREYITNNPLKWSLDIENPQKIKNYKIFKNILKR